MDDKDKNSDFISNVIVGAVYCWFGMFLFNNVRYVFKDIFLAEEQTQNYALIAFLVIYIGIPVLSESLKLTSLELIVRFWEAVIKFFREILKFFGEFFKFITGVGEQGNANRSALMLIGFFLLILAVIMFGTILVMKK
jgi:hypothetical protein